MMTARILFRLLMMTAIWIIFIPISFIENYKKLKNEQEKEDFK